VREPGKILAQAARTLDLSQPVGVLLIAVLHFIPDRDDPWAITARLIDGIPGDLHLVIGHAASDIRAGEAAEMSRQYNQRSASPITVRTKEQITRFFHGMDIWPPGVVPVSQWWPTPPETIPGTDVAGYSAIGSRPARGNTPSAQSTPTTSDTNQPGQRGH